MMKERGWEIVFVSTCVADHRNSKINFLARHFPFMDGFIDTRDKHFIAYDLLIDDKIDHHKKGLEYRPKAKHLLYTAIRRDGTDVEADKYSQLPGWGSLNVPFVW
jgi:5'(3')-deoxyribonucleotidase